MLFTSLAFGVAGLLLSVLNLLLHPLLLGLVAVALPAELLLEDVVLLCQLGQLPTLSFGFLSILFPFPLNLSPL